MDNKGKTALITGATSGIGYELAMLCAKAGYNIIIVAREPEELKVSAASFRKETSGSIVSIAKDLFEPGAAEELYNEITAKGVVVDVLINNAGHGVYGKFVETDLQDELDVIQLNVTSLVVLTKLFMKDMVARNDGKILQVASVISKKSSPLMAIYAGTKAFVYNFSQSLINELKDTGVTLTLLLPGATDTDFFNKAGAENTNVAQSDHLADPADVAKDGFDALMKGESRVISGMNNKLEVMFANILPDGYLAEQTRASNEPKK